MMGISPKFFERACEAVYRELKSSEYSLTSHELAMRTEVAWVIIVDVLTVLHARQRISILECPTYAAQTGDKVT